MGQQIGRLPDTWRELIEERDRVLRWSAEVLARVDDNITNEDTFLIDYDDKRIDEKVELWIASHRHKYDVSLSRFPDAPEQSRVALKNGVKKMADEMRYKMRRDYRKAYVDMKQFTKKVDALGFQERMIHEKIQSLEAQCDNDRKKFALKFGLLRKKVFRNLRKGEKMLFQEKRLKVAFTKKVYDVDHKHMAECAKSIDKLVKDFEKRARR